MISARAIKYTKVAADIICGLGVSKIVHDVIDTNTVVVTKSDFAKKWIGTIVIGSIVAERTSDHIDSKIDWIASWFTEATEEQETE